MMEKLAYTKYVYISFRMAKMKSVVKDVEELELWYTPSRDIKWYNQFGNSLAVSWKVFHSRYFPKKIKHMFL